MLRVVEGQPALIVRGGRGRGVAEECLHHRQRRRVSRRRGLRRVHERRAAPPIDSLDGGALIQQQLHGERLAGGRGHVERRRARLAVLCTGVGARPKQQAQARDAATLRGEAQGDT